MSDKKPLRHPRDLFTEEQQAQMDRELSNMAQQSAASRLRFVDSADQPVRLIYVNADAECDEALRMVEQAYGVMADRFDVAWEVLRDLAASDPWRWVHRDEAYAGNLNPGDGDVYVCTHCQANRVVAEAHQAEARNHSERCVWARACVLVAEEKDTP